MRRLIPLLFTPVLLAENGAERFHEWMGAKGWLSR